MLLTLDVGNTEITIGLFAGDRLEGHWRLTTNPDRTPDEWGVALGSFLYHSGHSPNAIRATVIASVAPGVTQSLADGVRGLTGGEVRVIDAASPLPIRLDVDEPRTVGADRIINTLAAVDRFHADTIVVDFGTTTTFDCITADGRFIGGVIMPGLRTASDDLVKKTAKLPATELTPPQH